MFRNTERFDGDLSYWSIDASASTEQMFANSKIMDSASLMLGSNSRWAQLRPPPPPWPPVARVYKQPAALFDRSQFPPLGEPLPPLLALPPL